MAQKSHKFKRLKLLVLFVFLCLSVAAFWKGGTQAQNQNLAEKAAHQPRVSSPTTPPATSGPQPEGCLKCHNNIEPMHRYDASDNVYDKLDEGKDAQGLTCTACHGGNP